MFKKPAKLNFQDLPFLKLAAGFLLLVLASTIVAGGWLTGPVSRIEKIPEIYVAGPSPIRLNKYKCLAYPYAGGGGPAWTDVLAADFDQALEYSPFGNNCIADEPLGYAYSQEGSVDGQSLVPLYAVSCIYNNEYQRGSVFYTTDQNTYNMAASGQIEGCTVYKQDVIAHVLPSSLGSQYKKLQLRSTYITDIEKDIYLLCLEGSACSGGAPNKNYELNAYIELFNSNPADGSQIQDKTAEMGYYKEISIGLAPSIDEVLLTIDTQTLIDDEKMKSDCFDMQFRNNSGERLDHWIENGCGTTDTQVWVKLKSPEVQTIKMYYNKSDQGDNLALDDTIWKQQDGGAKTILPFRGGCSSGWTLLSGNQYFRGSFLFGSQGSNGDGSHTHIIAGNTTPSGPGLRKDRFYTNSRGAFEGHGHRFVDITTEEQIRPKFASVPFCSSLGIAVKPSPAMVFFDNHLDGDWFSEVLLDLKFLLNSAHFDPFPSESSPQNHSHTFRFQIDPPYSCTETAQVRNNESFALADHRHWLTGNTSEDETLPPYKDLILAYTFDNRFLPKKAIIASNFEILPPLGWEHYEEVGGLFIRVNSNPGGVGGSELHRHTFVGQTGDAVQENRGPVDTDGDGGGRGRNFNSTRHTHNNSANSFTSYSSSLPVYSDLVFVQKKTDGLASGDVTIGEEQPNGNQPTPTPTPTDGPSPTPTLTPTPTPTGSPTPTPTPGAGGVEITVKFAGVTSRPANDDDQTIKIWGESLDGSIVLATKSSPLSVVFSVNDQGLYLGTLNLTEAQLGKHYRLVIKGPRHLGREFADVVLDIGNLILTGEGQELLPGDLNQDGLVNSVDVGIVNENTDPLVKNSTGDLNYDNYTEGLDKALIVLTLSFRQDPR